MNKRAEVTIRTISILGSGWLGLPLAAHFAAQGEQVKASTTSASRLPEIAALGVEPCIVDIGQLSSEIGAFLKSSILIINIPSKDLEGFTRLLWAIEDSAVENVLFVSSTSVYENTNKAISESDGAESTRSPLLAIENLFRCSEKFNTTVARMGGLIGYRRHPGRFFRNGRQVRDPDATVNLIHRDDCIGIISQIVAQEAWGEVFNCCADTHPTKREFYTRAAKSAGFPVPGFDDPGAKSFKVISNNKVKQALNYEFLHPDLMQLQFEQHA